MQVGQGTVFEPVHDARKPNVVLPPAGIARFHDAGVAFTAVPLVVTVAFQAWVIAWPLVHVQLTDQPPIAVEPAVTVTSPWKPPVHCPVSL